MPRTVAEVIKDAKDLAVEYRELTGKPLGVSGEVAEFEAHRLLGLELSAARSPGFDALRKRNGREDKIQIKGRAVDVAHPRQGRVPKIDIKQTFDLAALVLLDARTMEPFEIWEASYADVVNLLTKPGSKARNERGSPGISQFCRIATRIWCSPESERLVNAKQQRVERKLKDRAERRLASPPCVAFTPERRERWKRTTRNSPFNMWLRDQTAGPNGSIDLEKLYNLASDWGVHHRYDHLNPGMIRMNIGNRLRIVVPREVYESAAEETGTSGELEGLNGRNERL